MIPLKENSSFVAHMEMVLEAYKYVLDPRYPVVFMDEFSKQLIAETKTPLSAIPGQPERHDYEYRRCGVCDIFLACEPLAGRRFVKITERKTKRDWAFFLEAIASQYEEAEKITLVMGNLNTYKPGSLYDYKPGSLYEAFSPDHSKSLRDRFQFVYAPKHLGWLNMDKIEFNVFIGQCLSRRIDDIEVVRRESLA